MAGLIEQWARGPVEAQGSLDHSFSEVRVKVEQGLDELLNFIDKNDLWSVGRGVPGDMIGQSSSSIFEALKKMHDGIRKSGIQQATSSVETSMEGDVELDVISADARSNVQSALEHLSSATASLEAAFKAQPPEMVRGRVIYGGGVRGNLGKFADQVRVLAGRVEKML